MCFPCPSSEALGDSSPEVAQEEAERSPPEASAVAHGRPASSPWTPADNGVVTHGIGV